MSKKLYPIFTMLLTSCFFTTQTSAQNEPLINVYGKIMNSQYIEFLEKEGSKYKITTYSFHIDLKKNKKVFGGGNTIFYDLNSEYVNVKHYYTSDAFRKTVNRWNEKYYKAIHPNFVDMDNRKKMEVLDSLVSPPRSP